MPDLLPSLVKAVVDTGSPAPRGLTASTDTWYGTSGSERIVETRASLVSTLYKANVFCVLKLPRYKLRLFIPHMVETHCTDVQTIIEKCFLPGCLLLHMCSSYLM